MTIKHNYENPHILHVGSMPDRAYYIPASRYMGDLVEDRERSDRMQLLNGDWKFRYYESIYDLEYSHGSRNRCDSEYSHRNKNLYSLECSHGSKDIHSKDIHDAVSRMLPRMPADAELRPVPGVWQNYGYDCHQYTNFRYPYPTDPPYVPAENPCALYQCTFAYEKEERAPRAYLNFEGVDSCFYVWLNDAFLGYSQVSHSTSEFDVTDLILAENVLTVLVLKWCDGSYMEDQDKFRMSGIFRDVYLLKRPEACLYDYFVKTCLLQDGSARIRLDAVYLQDVIEGRDAGAICMPEDYVASGKKKDAHAEHNRYELSLYAGFPSAESLIETKSMEAAAWSDSMDGQQKLSAQVTFSVKEPHLWNPEDPYLYTLIIRSEDETIVERVGIREICVEDTVVKLNGQAIKFQGVNRHESDPVTGPVVSMEQMKRDLRLMREHNFNAIRTSHYPDVPMFYQLCDQYGFMVIDEADNESHGPVTNYYKDQSRPPEARWNELISDHPDYIEATVDRVQRMIRRDKNRPSILIWSMGNECGYGCTIEETLRWTKSYDSSRLTHYESAYHDNGHRAYDYSNLDLYSRMYPSLEEMEDYAHGRIGYGIPIYPAVSGTEETDKSVTENPAKDDEILKSGRLLPDRPMILCEYCHAMGNGPGDVEDYYQLMESYDCMCGGFAWEWCDHAIDKGPCEDITQDKSSWCEDITQDKDVSRRIYYYGGDHGELLHDGNFCMDGLVYPDRRPHTGLSEYKNVYRPVRASYDPETNLLTLENRFFYTNLGDKVKVEYVLERDGILLYRKRIPQEELRKIGPRDKAEIKIDHFIPETGSCYLKIYAYNLLEDDYLMGYEEIPLANMDSRNQTVLYLLRQQQKDNQKKGRTLFVSEMGRHLVISNGLYRYRYNILTGMFDSIFRYDTESGYSGRNENTESGYSGQNENMESGYNGRNDEFRSAMAIRGMEYLQEPMRISIWRAPTDNDRNIKYEWMRAGYDRVVGTRAYQTEYQVTEDGVEIHSKLGLLAVGIQRIMDIDVTWKVLKIGGLELHMNVKRNMDFLELPRFGLRMLLPEEMDYVEYYGMGPMESYADKHRAAMHGLYRSSVQELHEDYIRPQENGSHCDTSYLRVSGPRTDLVVMSESSFSFNASPYTEEELTVKAHNYELQPSGSTVLHIDYKQNGIGSNSCGPELLPRYRFDDETFAFDLKMMFLG